MAKEAKFIDGTVTAVGREEIEIDFGTEACPIIVQHQASSIPASLHRYGQPIRLTRHADGRYEWTERPLRPVEPLPGEAEIDAWIESL